MIELMWSWFASRFSAWSHFHMRFHLAIVSPRVIGALSLVLAVMCLLPVPLSAQRLADGKGRFLGGSVGSSISRHLTRYWNQMTPGNAGKWGSVSFSQGQYNWTYLDSLYNYALQNGMIYKHHTLVWGSQQPGWIAGLDTATQRREVENWIRLVGQRYPKMNFVDVVNEPLHTPLPSYKNGLGGDGATGWDWVITAFTWARQYCAPGVKLILNDYNILGNTTSTTNYLTIINLLKDRKLIDGIGVQGHYFEFRSRVGTTGYVYNLADIKSNLNRLTATGLPVYITEFDVDEPVDSDQLAQYMIYFPIFWTNPSVKGITFWGYVDDDVWTSYPDTYLLYANGRSRPAFQWLQTYITIPVPPALMSPVSVNGTPRDPQLVWQSSTLATSYHVQLADNRSFSPLVVDTTLADTTLNLRPLAANVRYYWRVTAANSVGTSDYSVLGNFLTGEVMSDVEQTGAIPSEYSLSQNYPNPFNPKTAIGYQLLAISFVKLEVFDVLGRGICTLVNEARSAGSHTVDWDGSTLPSGVYYYRLQARPVNGQEPVFIESRKMTLMK
ncbi:MAG: endo-1,4-beta-xylanase [Ignavibacteriales bacterium]|nr:endo-1,4-beta-xylanase [Ignavibacteriales bacterium]